MRRAGCRRVLCPALGCGGSIDGAVGVKGREMISRAAGQDKWLSGSAARANFAGEERGWRLYFEHPRQESVGRDRCGPPCILHRDAFRSGHVINDCPSTFPPVSSFPQAPPRGTASTLRLPARSPLHFYPSPRNGHGVRLPGRSIACRMSVLRRWMKSWLVAPGLERRECERVCVCVYQNFPGQASAIREP